MRQDVLYPAEATVVEVEVGDNSPRVPIYSYTVYTRSEPLAEFAQAGSPAEPVDASAITYNDPGTYSVASVPSA